MKQITITYYICWICYWVALFFINRKIWRGISWFCRTYIFKEKVETISHDKSPTECGIYRTIEQIEIDELDPIDYQLKLIREDLQRSLGERSKEMTRWGTYKSL